MRAVWAGCSSTVVIANIYYRGLGLSLSTQQVVNQTSTVELDMVLDFLRVNVDWQIMLIILYPLKVGPFESCDCRISPKVETLDPIKEKAACCE